MANRRRAAGRKTSTGIPVWIWPWLMLLVGLVLGWTAYRIYLRRPRPAPAPLASPIPAPIRQKARPSNYAFYTMLPEMESVLPGQRRGAPEHAPKGSHYILQAASFPDYRQADAMKARIALHGLEARIQKVSIQGRGVYYRVRLGPYATLASLNRADRVLAGLGIHAMRLAVRDLPRR